MNNPIFEIEQKYGQSIWMDNLSRDLIVSGDLQKMIESRGIEGITSNPAIFEKAIAGNQIYDHDIESGSKAGLSTLEIYESLVFEDITNACKIFYPIYENTEGLDGYVSLEVPPTISSDTNSTISEAKRYFSTLKQKNLMIKIPGTPEGLPAVTEVISSGINVNVTLLFSVDSYVDTAWAYIKGLELRAERGEPIDNISSVASFFLSRIDTNIDNRLDALLKAGVDEATETKIISLKGKIAVANAKVAYQKYKEIFSSERWLALAAKGARKQRLLWASTGAKNPNYSDVMYVDELIGADTVNTLPPQTIEACSDHCSPGNRIESDLDQAYQYIEALKDPAINIDLDSVMAELLQNGIDLFVKPFGSLMNSIETKVKQLTPTI
jgi:transaldolase